MDQVSKHTTGIYITVEKIFTSLEQTLSTQAYSNIISLLQPILTISLILLTIYVIYSTIHFLHSLITKGRLKIRIIISVVLASIFLILSFVIYNYLFGLTFLT